jgi:nicotinamidase-related amidase
MKTALLVIDVQRGLFEAEPPPDEAREVLERINGLTGRARAVSVPVIFVQHEAEGTPLQHGSDAWQLDRRLSVDSADLRVRKRTPDSFLRTDLGARLKALGTKRLIICGYASDFCVDTTTRSAATQGFDVVLVSDAHTTHDRIHATGAQIRAHENATLPHLALGPVIELLPARDVVLVT